MALTIATCKQEFLAAEGFVKRHLTMTWRYAAWEVVFLVYTMVNTLTIGLIGAATGSPEQTLFLVVGAVLWGFLSVIFHEVAETIAWERWQGTIEYTFMAPIHRFTHLAAVCASAIVYGTVRTLVVLSAVAVFFDLPLARANMVTAVVVLTVSSLSFMGLGILAATLPLLSPEKGPQAAHIVQAGILLVSGVYYDVAVLPPWVRPLSVLSPATYTLRSMRAAILDGAPCGNVVSDLAVLAVTGMIMVPVGMAVFGRAEVYAMRAGLLKRQG